ncbi:MAG: hypothetical protein ACQEWM_02645 [Actinomycetota bacterium]
MTRSFRLPLLGIRVPLSAAGVRALAAAVLLLACGHIAAVAASPLPSAREHLAPPIAIALSLVALIATVPSLLDGRLRFPVAGVGSLCLGLLAAVAIGLGAPTLVSALGWVVVVVAAANGVYHLLGTEPDAQDHDGRASR